MKALKLTNTAILSLFLGIGGPVYAQQQEKQDHPQQQQGKPQQQHAQQHRQVNGKQQRPQKPEQGQEQSKQRQHAQQRQDQNDRQEHAHQQQRPAQSQQRQRAQQQRDNQPPRRTQEQQRVQQSAWQQHRAQSWQSDHRTWQQRGGYNGYRIPDDRFHGYFGPNHGFRIYGRPFLVVAGYPRFQYSGYWFSLVDPWPEYWANDWYDTDDVYVTYVDNGYYLFNRRYPRTGIAISISM